MNDSLIVDTLFTKLSTQTDSLVSKLANVQEQIALLNEAHAAVQSQCYLLLGMVVVALLLVLFLIRRRLSVVEQRQCWLDDNIQDKVEKLVKRINNFEKSIVEQLASKGVDDKPCVPEATPTSLKKTAKSQPANTALASEPEAYQSIASDNHLRVKYGSIQAPDSEGVLRIADRSLSNVSSPSKWFVISYQEGSSTATYTINLDAMGEILQDLQTFQLFTAPFTLSNAALPTHVSVAHEGVLHRVEKGWVVKKRLVVKF